MDKPDPQDGADRAGPSGLADQPSDPSKRAALKTLAALGLLAAASPTALLGGAAAPKAGAGGAAAARRPRVARPNIVLLTLDTTRFDDIGCYGAKVKTPNLDSLARDGILFRNAYANAPITAPSHTSMLTGLYPRTHGVRNNMDRLPDGFTIAPQRLKALGYHSAAFVSVHFLKAASSGLNRGWDYWNEDFTGAKYAAYREAGIVTREVRKWLPRGAGQQPFFAWLHYYDPHGPYDPPAAYRNLYYPDYHGTANGDDAWLNEMWLQNCVPTRDDLRYVRALYDGEITYMDAEIGRFLDELKSRDLYRDALIMAVADHGEEFYLHAPTIEHAGLLWDTTLHVPLLMKLPGNEAAGRQVLAPVESVDLLPTVLDYLAQYPGKLPGHSMLPWVEKDEPESSRAIVSETFAPEALSDAAALHKGAAKLIVTERGRGSHYYDLTADPTEEDDLYLTHQEEADRLAAELAAWQDRKPSSPPAGQQLDQASKDALRSLGYTR